MEEVNNEYKAVDTVDSIKKEVNREFEEVNKKEVKHYDNAHLVLYCGKCKAKYILEENITKGQGVTISLPPTSDAQIRLVCKECSNEMGLFYIEAKPKTDENDDTEKPSETVKEKESEQVSEANTEVAGN